MWRLFAAKALVWDLDVILCIGVWIGAPSMPSSVASIGSVCCGRVGLVGWCCRSEGGGGGHSNIIIRYRYVYVCVSYITSCNAMFTVHMFCLADEKN